MRLLPSCVRIVAVLVVGCGGEDPAPSAGAAPAAATASASATPTPSPTTTATSDRVEIMQLATDYWKAVADDDSKAACELLTPSEQKHFERKFGSCPKAFNFTAAQRKGTGDWRAGVVTLDGDRARISTVGDSGGEEGPDLLAVREDGKWGIVRTVAYRRAA
ncbi:hypothetical protein OJ997_09085 [Solirubrobacter phytolaccae]|uniref:Uncharacterized protein n=1 Tax=Solirubrobacter phytolaccae TaxID=1404360 RepID=A0A9X3N5V5_9ACTN|nr:hypothetical protein [Solirubrobacter phytolaccae]MDA0180445.1 hypothetical protein [Solirubrobacter phytolaccae]